jgi:GT2 family glycosyltransferase
MSAAARAILASDEARKPADGCAEQYAAYGCNMVVRLAPIHAHRLRFDENLPFYGWLEDIDFCRRLAPFGHIVKNQRMAGVHLGYKAGRPKGVPLGYSQIANRSTFAARGATGSITLCRKWQRILPRIAVSFSGRSRG